MKKSFQKMLPWLIVALIIGVLIGWTIKSGGCGV